jgi:hypothetical protein
VTLQRNILISLAVVAFTLLCVEGLSRWIVSTSYPEQSSSKVFDRKYYLAKAPVEQKKSSILLLGDSYMNMGLYPELLQKRLLEKAGIETDIRNLASPNNTPEMSLFLLKTAIASGIKPKIVIYNVSPTLFNKTRITNPEETPEKALSNSYIGKCLYQSPSHFSGQVECTLDRYSYFFRYRSYFKEQLSQWERPLFGVEKKLRRGPLESPHVESEISPGGWGPGYSIYTESQFQNNYKLTEEHVQQYTKTTGKTFVWTDKPFQKLQHYCQEQHIPLLLAWFPSHPLQKTYSQQLNRLEQHEQFETKMEALGHLPGIWFLNFHDSDADTDHYYNVSHLNILGAIELTNKVADVLLTPAFQSKFMAKTSASEPKKELIP